MSKADEFNKDWEQGMKSDFFSYNCSLSSRLHHR